MQPERSAYPEGCYISYLRAKTIGLTHLAIDKMASVSNFNHAYFTSLLNMIGSSATSGNADSLVSDLACYLFATVDDFQICEQDYSISADSFNLIVRNSIQEDPIIEDLGAYLAVDWRNWAR